MVQIACPCPPLAGGEPRHESDTVELKPRLGFVEAASVRNRVALRRSEAGDEELGTDEILAVLTEGYLLYGITSWTLEDDNGPLPLTRSNVRAYVVDRWEIASVVADAADDLYAEAVMLPLLKTASTSSQPSPMADSTSANPPSGTPLPEPSSRSSITTIPTADTETTTSRPATASNGSRKSTSAA